MDNARQLHINNSVLLHPFKSFMDFMNENISAQKIFRKI